MAAARRWWTPITGLGARTLRADLQCARSRRPHHPVAARSALRRRPRLPRQPPARPRGAGRGVLPAAARVAAGAAFLLGGTGWDDKACRRTCARSATSAPADHNAFNCSRAGGAERGARQHGARSASRPATRVFEAAGAGACLITDAWEGIELFLEPGAGGAGGARRAGRGGTWRG